MSVRKTFKTAALLAGTVLSSAFAPSALAALNVGQCVTASALQAEGQIPVIQAGGIAVEDPRIISLVMYSSNADGSQGYELIGKRDAGTKNVACYEVRSVLTNVRMNNYQTGEIRADFYSQADNAFNTKLRANIQAGNLPILQADKMSAASELITIYTNTAPTPNFVAGVGKIDPSIVVKEQAATAVFVPSADQNKLVFAMVNPVVNKNTPKNLYGFQPSLAAN